MNPIYELKATAIKNLVLSGKRKDKRKFDEMRNIEIKTGVIKNAEGSAWVKLGNTEVVAGVKLEISQPFPDNPEEGILIVNSELLPIASPEFDLGPPDENAIELARVVDRGIRESKTIDLSDLSIIPGEKVWGVFIDFYAINQDGNLFDAGLIASIAALLNAKVPKIDEEGNKIKGEYDRKIKVKKIPLSFTFVKIAGKLLLDPQIEEEYAAEARLTMTLDGEGNLVALQKALSGSFTKEEILKMLEISKKKYKEVINVLENIKGGIE